MTANRNRANGEGSIFPYKNGYAAYVWVTKPDGTRNRKYVYGKTREDVHGKWVGLHDRARKGPVATRSPKLGEFLQRWLRDVVVPNLSRKAAETYEMHVRLYLTPGLGEKRLDKLTVTDVQQWLNKLAVTCQCCAQGKDVKRGLAKHARYRSRCCAIGKCCQQTVGRSTIADARARLREALNRAIVEELVTRNVATLAKLPRERKKRSTGKPWTVEDAQRFLVSAQNDEDPFYAAYVLILVAGLRRGEVLGLTWPNVDLDAAELNVGHGLQRIGGELVLGDPKTEASEAMVPLPDICTAALKLRQADQDAAKAAIGQPWPDPHDLVFTSRFGTPIDPRNFVRSFKRRCALAGVRLIRVHDTLTPAVPSWLRSTYTRASRCRFCVTRRSRSRWRSTRTHRLRRREKH